MSNLLHYPDTALVEKVIPKASFYRHLDVSPHIKERFVSDVLSVTWIYKLAPSTLNVRSTHDIPEVEIFLADLKDKECPTDLFLFIDQYMPHHIVFILRYGGQYRFLINYKEWATEEHTRFNVTDTFLSPWMSAEQLSLPVNGTDMRKIYEGFVAHIGQQRIGQEDGTSLPEAVARMQQRETLQKRIDNLTEQMYKECQPRKKFFLHCQIQTLKQQLSEQK